MRLEQGAICDYCGKIMQPYEYVNFKYEAYAPDETRKIVSSTKAVNFTAMNLCKKCARRASNNLEAKITTGKIHPYRIFANRCKKQLRINLYEEET